jgi:small subunit ribosomal protein S16
MIMIRLQRVGKIKTPSYRVIVSDKRRDTQGRYLELLGQYYPLVKDPAKQLTVDAERIKHWIGLGAQASLTLENLLVKAGMMKAPEKKRRSVAISKRRQVKLDAKKAKAE